MRVVPCLGVVLLAGCSCALSFDDFEERDAEVAPVDGHVDARRTEDAGGDATIPPSDSCAPTPERCDGVDNNCDGMVDEETSGRTGLDCADGYSCVDGHCGNDVRALVAYHQSSCAQLQNGELWCWGLNNRGQLGNGTTSETLEAQPVLLGDGTRLQATQVDLGPLHGCAISQTGTGYCWGANSFGELGSGGPNSTHARAMEGGGTPDHLSAGAYFTCITEGPAVRCVGQNDTGQLATSDTTDSRTFVGGVGTNGPFGTISTGEAHTCLVVDDDRDEVDCWGLNDQLQLGSGDTRLFEPRARAVRDIGGITRLTTGHSHSCAINTDGELWCWGDNGAGQIGDGTDIDAATPLRVDIDGRVSAAAAGGLHTCAIRSDRPELYCWGRNTSNELGYEGAGTSTPTLTTLDEGAVEVTAGNAHTCVLLQSGLVHCWGRNEDGELGRGSTGNPSAQPMPVLGLPRRTS